MAFRPERVVILFLHSSVNCSHRGIVRAARARMRVQLGCGDCDARFKKIDFLVAAHACADAGRLRMDREFGGVVVNAERADRIFCRWKENFSARADKTTGVRASSSSRASYNAVSLAPIVTSTLWPSHRSGAEPVEGPQYFSVLLVRSSLNIGAIARAAQAAAGRGVGGLPSVCRPDELKLVFVENAQGIARGNLLDGSKTAVNFQIFAQFLPALRLAVARIDRIDAVENFAVHGRAQQLEVFGVSPTPTAQPTRQDGQNAGWSPANPARPTPARAAFDRTSQSLRRFG